jgi:hypothetical protein
MLKREFGFSQVMLANGQTGYVATEDLKLAPPEPPAPRTASSSALFPARGNATAAGAPGKKKRSSAPWSRPQPEPKLDLSDVPAPPLPQDPEPSPASPPKMRY